MSVSLNSNKNSATAEISNHEADPLSCKHCPVNGWATGKYCDEFQAAGRCIRAALVSAINSGKVQIIFNDVKLMR